MVTEYFAQHLDRSSMSLNSMFGIMTTLNSIVAIISGVLGESLVAATGTKVSPFMAAVVCLGLAYWLISQNWVSLCLSECIFQTLSVSLLTQVDRELWRQCRSQKARNTREIYHENYPSRFVHLPSLYIPSTA
jgi:hypothetical protein